MVDLFLEALHQLQSVPVADCRLLDRLGLPDAPAKREFFEQLDEF
jgi:hypothetical protein